MRKMPNFIVIGAGKSGSTTLSAMLSLHPQIYMSPLKEPCYFCNDELDPSINRSAVGSLADYQALFTAARDHIAVGEVSPQYISKVSAPRRISSTIPDVKLIAILRNPIDRAYSLYMHFRRDGFEKEENFLEAIRTSKYRSNYIEEGKYGKALNNYLKYFDASQLHIIIFDDFRADPGLAMRGLFEFLGVDVNVKVLAEVDRNVSGLPQSLVLKYFLRIFAAPKVRARIRSTLPHRIRNVGVSVLHKWMERDLKKTPISDVEKQCLIDEFREDVAITSQLIGRDLDYWVAEGYQRQPVQNAS